ncbi:MAG: 50S ribosomal protein L25 [Chlamydiales bacterium]|nr:50S ribosomal protein L25 [Chlamydiales bacterium]MCH9619222.1 50S ribosomal protein L25 [Chlamydiales bacterium]MCH9622484.1 50S ribosomal protein L25 [Chlamydiales bacterium]
MKLNVTKRTTEKKSIAKQIRREGNIPAIIYSKGKVGTIVTVDGNEFKKILNKIPKGTLSSKVLTLVLDGKETKVIVKDIHYHVTTYAILHLDFVELHDDVEVTLNIPVVCVGAADCQGVKLGGVLRQVIRQLKVKALPKNIPAQFDIDVQDLMLGGTKRLRDIKIPSGVTPVPDLKEVAVVIGRR